MAPRRGAEVVEEEPTGGLTFNEPLSWRAGKPIATGELLRRLDVLANELREMDQDETDKNSLTKVAKELAGHNLLSHKDKGVRAFTACCLVDVLKICAPDAPFTPTQLKDIFTMFVTSILPQLSDPSHAYNTQHKYVLVSLAEVKSIVLLCDIQNSDTLILHLFSAFFDTLSGSSKTSTGEQVSKDVEYHMTQMLVTLVDEAQNLPTEVVDIIVAQFLRASTPGGGKTKGETDEKQSTLLLKELPEAYNMAKTICNSCPEKMARYISQYFNDVILEVSAGGLKTNGNRRTSDGAADSDDEDAHTGPTEADMKELQKAHKLLRELWRASPTVLQNVIPQLDAELGAENVQLRLLATETLGDIISGIGAAGPPPPPSMDPATYPPARLEDYSSTPTSNSILTTPISPQSFAQTHPSVYHNFMGRKNDKSLIIRSGWTTAIGRILVTSAGGIGLSTQEESSLVKGLAEKLNDADDRVRLAAVKAIGTFNLRDIMAKLAPNGSVSDNGSVLNSLADRSRDRKHAVSVEAMTTLGRIWGVAAGEIVEGNESVIKALGGIPTRILDVFYANNPELNVLLDKVIFEQLMPLAYPPSKPKGKKDTNGDSQTQTNGDGPFDADKIRTQRILLVINSLEKKSRMAFFVMQARQPQLAKVLELFLKQCEAFNGGVMDDDSKPTKQKLDQTVNYISNLLPESHRAAHDLLKYAKMHDRRTYQLLRFAMAPESDFSTVHKAIKEFQKRIQSASGAPATLLETIMPIVYRSSSLVYNRSHQPVFLQYSRTDEDGLGATANAVMKEISDKLPEIFQASVKELCKALEEQAPSKTKSNDAGSVDTLKALASFAKSHQKDIPHDRKFVQTLISFASYGTPPKAAKYAVSILAAAAIDRKEMHMKDLLDKSTRDWEFGGDHFLTKLATISQLTLLEPQVTEEANDDILDITTKKLLLQSRTPKTDEDPVWQSNDELDEECEAKCWAIRILVNRLRVTKEPETAKTLAVPVYKLLNALIVKEGELVKDGSTPRHHKARLRLLAAQQMLKLCTNKMFDDFLSPVEFNKLAFVTQDPLNHVRRAIVEKLQKYLVKGHLTNRFLTIIFLTAFEPDTSFRNSIMTWIRSRAKHYHDSKKYVFESVFPRLLHLCAHHPDFSLNPEELADHARYIVYYLQTVASEENLPLIFKYAQRVKQAKDGLTGSDSENLYVMSDLAQSLAKKWEEKRGWSMQTWTAKVGMPVGLFVALPSHEVAQEIAERIYMPEEMDDLLDGLIKEVERKKTKRKSDDREDGPSKRQKSSGHSRPSKTPIPKKEKIIKEKKTPKLKKARRSSSNALSTPVPSSVDRRKSSRGVSAKKVYADRDSDQDDEEMLDGVAKWDYFDQDGAEVSDADAQSESEGSVAEPIEEDQEEENVDAPESEPEVEAELEPELEPDIEADEDEETEPAPPASNGRRSSRRTAPITKAKPKVNSPMVKAKSPLVTSTSKRTVKAKESISKPKKAAVAKGKGKGKSKSKDVFDMDESE